jgi:hypothetical protein
LKSAIAVHSWFGAVAPADVLSASRPDRKIGEMLITLHGLADWSHAFHVAHKNLVIPAQAGIR